MPSMYSSPGLPTQTWSNPHRRTRLSAHRIRESLTSRFAKCLCSILLSLVLVAGIIVFILWLSLRPHRPRFHLVAFAAPGVATPAGLSGSPISFNVTDRNANAKIGIYYDAMFGSVYYKDRVVGSGPVMFPFFQPPKNTTLITGQLSGSAIEAGGTLSSQLSAEAAAGRAELRLELNSTIRFKVKTWDTHHHHLHVECDLVVGSDGSILPESKNIKCPIYF
ncbi:NDR1/HIN1-like protein 13 [Musa acuminata AAA Group]|uniref:NDR1/HIN1-like protein 13 n=1 Tax=Musa acuminata AAA Group TaxID=214697 RepID=UPI0031D8D0A5